MPRAPKEMPRKAPKGPKKVKKNLEKTKTTGVPAKMVSAGEQILRDVSSIKFKVFVSPTFSCLGRHWCVGDGRSALGRLQLQKTGPEACRRGYPQPMPQIIVFARENQQIARRTNGCSKASAKPQAHPVHCTSLCVWSPRTNYRGRDARHDLGRLSVDSPGMAVDCGAATTPWSKDARVCFYGRNRKPN